MATDRPLDPVIAQALRRAARADFERWMTMVHASGCCAQPVRLTGRVRAANPETGELAVVYNTATEPDRVLLKACGTRQATRCPACAAIYRADAKALLRGGLEIDGPAGDTGPDSPLVFVTLTAPSFGPVHRISPDRPCRALPPGAVCPHGRTRACHTHHRESDPKGGQALCPACYDFEAAVIFNARAGELWRRTLIAVGRRLATTGGLSRKTYAQEWRVAFAKVVEFQARGVIHIHALARLDHLEGPDVLTGTDLAAAFAAAAARTTAPNPADPDRPIHWGSQMDIEVIPHRRRRAAAAYLAKYATKSVDHAGMLDRRLRGGDLSTLDLPDQLRQMAETAWRLGGRPDLAELNLRAWAHSLGWRGHWLTKSRHWSTTFGELRAARQRFRLAQLGISEQEAANRWGEWELQGVGHLSAGDAWLAASANAEAKAARRAAWEEA